MRRPFVSSSWSQPGNGVRCLSTTKVRLSSQPHAGNLCPPSNRTPSCTHSTCHATHQCHGCIVCRLPTTIPHSPPRYLAGKETGSAPHGSGRIGGLGLPGRALLAPGATCPKIQLPCLVTGSGRASPGLSLVTQNKQSLLTGREVRDAKRRRPLYLKGSSSCYTLLTCTRLLFRTDTNDLTGGARRGKGAMVTSLTSFVLREGPN